ncbi:MAG: hypothetical protein IIA09_17680 [Proteobacteria bacterium]|nr:hypothetical protein [Pseudomonadota bacterium]
MTHEKLDNLVTIGQLKVEDSSEAEVTGLIQSGVARLEDARNTALNIESRFDLAYNAAHALSLAALRRMGYRSQSRYIVFQCLRYTLDLPNEQWRVLDQAHRKRNIAEYDWDMDVDEALVDAIIRVTEEVALRLK